MKSLILRHHGDPNHERNVTWLFGDGNSAVKHVRSSSKRHLCRHHDLVVIPIIVRTSCGAIGSSRVPRNARGATLPELIAVAYMTVLSLGLLQKTINKRGNRETETFLSTPPPTVYIIRSASCHATQALCQRIPFCLPLKKISSKLKMNVIISPSPLSPKDLQNSIFLISCALQHCLIFFLFARGSISCEERTRYQRKTKLYHPREFRIAFTPKFFLRILIDSVFLFMHSSVCYQKKQTGARPGAAPRAYDQRGQPARFEVSTCKT